jgi:prevent-host-death family protein
VSTRSIRTLRADLAAAVRRAAEGERIVVTVSGRPTAQLGPLDDQAPDLDRLIAAGAVLPPRRRGQWRPPEAVAVWSGIRIDRVLVELRG